MLTTLHEKRIGSYFYSYNSYGNGENLVLILHGLPQSREFAKEMITNFGSKYTVLALDLPGNNFCPTQNIYHYPAFVNYFKNLIDAYNPKTVSLIGYSWGGLLSLKYAELTSDNRLALVTAWASPLNGLNYRLKLLYHFIKTLDSKQYELFLNKGLKAITEITGIPLTTEEYDCVKSISKHDLTKYIEMISDFKIENELYTKTLFVFADKDLFLKGNEMATLPIQKINNFEIAIVPRGGHFATKEGWRKSQEIIISQVRKCVENTF